MRPNRECALSGITVQTQADPLIGHQPASVRVKAGERARFEVQLAGENPWNYQWYLESNAIAGATNVGISTLSIKHQSLRANTELEPHFLSAL